MQFNCKAVSALPPKADRESARRCPLSAKSSRQQSEGVFRACPRMVIGTREAKSCRFTGPSDGKLVLQILFDRGISDRHVDQCSLKARDELVVFDRIDGSAAVARQHALLGAKTSGRVPTLGGAMIDYLRCFGWNLLVGPSRLVGGRLPVDDQAIAFSSALLAPGPLE